MWTFEKISRHSIFLLAFLVVQSAVNPVFAHEQEADGLMKMSFYEEALDMEIVSVSKIAARFQDVASSIYVITEHDIRR